MKQIRVSEEDRRQFQENGFVVIRNVFSPEEMRELREAHYELWMDNIRSGVVGSSPSHSVADIFPELHETYRIRPIIKQYVTDARNFEIIQALIGEEALAVGSTFYFKAPGMSELVYHQDNYDVGAAPGTSIACWISLDHTDPENGGLRYIPGTHKYGFLPINLPTQGLCEQLPGIIRQYGTHTAIENVPDSFSVVDLTTGPGDVVLHSGYVLHGSYANRSPYRFRHALGIHFVGASTERLFMFHNQLMDAGGELVRRKLNKQHASMRTFNSYEVLYNKEGSE